MTPLRLMALACILAWPALVGSLSASASPACRAEPLPSPALTGRVDSLLPVGSTDLVMALVGRPNAPISFLPHDSLAVFDAANSAAATHLVELPPYITAPGLAAAPDGTRLYVFLDGTVLTLDGHGGRVIARQDLHMQAIGWPAAVTSGTGGDLYLIGQPAGALAAQIYAYAADRRAVLRLRWRAPIGLTHAGTWIGLTRAGQPAVYAPDAHDVHGTVFQFDATDGTLRTSYNVTMPPSAADAALDRLYLAGTGVVRALDLRSGVMVASTGGDAPLAASTALNLVAFMRGGQVQIARARDLHPLLEVPPRGDVLPTALGWQGPNLLVGSARGLQRFRVESCS